MARKIRQRVKNPAVAEKLIPKNHGFGTRRLPLETFYYEVYNQDNVELVDIMETPIERITPEGIKTSAKEYEFDIIIYATGFDAITGSFRQDRFPRRRRRAAEGQMEARAADLSRHHGRRIPQHDDADGAAHRARQHSAQHRIQRRLGHRPDALCAGQQADAAGSDAAGVASWTDHVKALGVGLLSNEVNSWMTGINSNVEGKQTRIIARYSGSAPAYRARCDEVAAKGYEELAG